ncbi:Ldh family oxidoreductase [Algibacillus agarilyticus]|uniref:Ldh family oxidoreductase n=1 Tax=Algibacillus agarilyticus TaxID=2234133 RepID=UPI000DD0E8DE|nr:Ldh family oxidoreductase [Algibacillus agarilyticus]
MPNVETKEIQYYSYDFVFSMVSHTLQNWGASLNFAELETQVLLEADLQEVPSHGIKMLSQIAQGIQSEILEPTAQPKLIKNQGACSIIDCNNGLGRASSMYAIDLAVNNAKKYGIGLCVARNTTHWGRAHAYAARAAKQECIALCATNALPSMTLGNAHSAILGNNPIGFAVPDQNSECPITLDMAMSQSSVGKVVTAKRDGQKVPDNWGIDEQGNRTTDPNKILDGAVLPMAGYKGESLAVMLEYLTAILAEGRTGIDLGVDGQKGVDANSSKTFIAIHVPTITSLNSFTSASTQFTAQLNHYAPAFRLPGSRGWQAQQRNNLNVPIHTETVFALQKIGINLMCDS